MNKLRTNILLCVITLISIPFLSSCLDDDKETPFLGIGTIEVIEGNDYYFLLDNGETIFPGDTTSLYKYQVEGGKRVIVYFYKINEDVSGYTYNGKILHVEDILTKDIIPLTENIADSIGDDRVDIQNVWFAGNCLNVEFKIQGTRYPDQKHMVNLVRNMMKDRERNIDEDGYEVLEFRHNAYDDSPVQVLDGIVAFKQPFVYEEQNVRGLKIKYNSIYEGVKYRIIEFDNGKNAQSFRSHHTNYNPFK